MSIPVRPGPKPRQHRTELLVTALKEQFKHDVDVLKEFLTVDGRPIFTVRLTPDEELSRFRDPTMMQQVLADIERRQGPEAVGKYIQHMYTLMRQQEQRDLAKWRSAGEQ